MFFLAIRHLLSRKRQTIFTLLGILFGSMSFVVISGFFTGFQTYLIDQLVNNDAHIHIRSKDVILGEHELDLSFYGKKYAHVFWISPPAGHKDSARILNPADWYKRLDADPRVEAYSPQLTTDVIMIQSKSPVNAVVIGCDPHKIVKVNTIADSIDKGDFLDLTRGGNRLIVGAGLLERLGARVSQTVRLSTGKGESTPFKIVGTFRTGITPIDEGRAYGRLSDIQKLRGTPNEINDIAVRLEDLQVAAQIADTWSGIAQERVQSWDQINANFLSVVNIQNITKNLMIAVILLIASFGIYNVLNMTVTQKRKEIAILRSMGYENLDIISLFFSQGLILGIIGGLLGLILGYWICLYLRTVPFGGGTLGGTGYLQVAIYPAIYYQAMALALVSSLVASVLPARAAGKLTPIEIIRAGTE